MAERRRSRCQNSPTGSGIRRVLEVAAGHATFIAGTPRGTPCPGQTPSASIVVLGLLLAACASAPTPYQAAQGGFGYSEQQIEENRYRVSFAGNAATTRPTVEDYLLYRAAELTVQTGHDWFEVVDRNTVQEYSGYGGSPEMGVGVGSGGGFGVGLSFPVLGGGGGSGSYTASMDVLVHDGEKPQENANAYDAFSVISRLQPKILAGGS